MHRHGPIPLRPPPVRALATGALPALALVLATACRPAGPSSGESGGGELAVTWTPVRAAADPASADPASADAAGAEDGAPATPDSAMDSARAEFSRREPRTRRTPRRDSVRDTAALSERGPGRFAARAEARWCDGLLEITAVRHDTAVGIAVRLPPAAESLATEPYPVAPPSADSAWTGARFALRLPRKLEQLAGFRAADGGVALRRREGALEGEFDGDAISTTGRDTVRITGTLRAVPVTRAGCDAAPPGDSTGAPPDGLPTVPPADSARPVPGVG